MFLFDLQSKVFWKITKLKNIIFCIQFPSLIQIHLVSSRIFKLDVLHKGVKLKEMYYPLVSRLPILRQKTRQREVA